jgi:hypothetical protein
MLKNPTSMKEILRVQNSTAISREVSFALLLDVCAGNYQRALVDESGKIRTQMGTHNCNGRSARVALYHHPVAVIVYLEALYGF